MPARTVTCGDCGAKMVFPAGDWNTVQSPAISSWQDQHEQDAHDGEEVSGWEVDPNPMND